MAGAGAVAEALAESAQQIVALSPDRVAEDGPEAFDPFRRAVTQASRGRDAPPSQLLGPVESKEMVLKFLVALHGSKKMYRRQVVAVMAVLMHEKLWLKSLLQIEGFPENLSEDLRLIVEEEQKTMENEPEEPELPAEETSTARRSSRLDRSVQQLAAARFQLQQIGFCATDTDAAGEAFTVFNRAVLWIVQSPEQEDDEVLSKMEEKESVLEFLADFHDRRPKHRARITQLCVRLLEFETWRELAALCHRAVPPSMSHVTSFSPLRNSDMISLTFVMSSLVLVPLGMAICGLCYVAGDLRWKPWILALGAGFGSFLAILWGVAAEILHKPRVLLTGSYVALLMFLLPLALAFHEPTTWNWCLDTMCMTGSIVVGNLMSMALSHLPLTGAEPAQRHVPGTAACKAAALAEMFEAVAIWQKPTTAALLRHRQCRLRILTASHEFRRATAAAAFELWQMPTADGEEWEVFSQEAESCRIALQLKSGMLAFGFSPATTKLWYQGALGEALRRSCFTAAYALRCAAGRLAKLSGDQPPPEVPAAPWLTSDYTTALECQEAAEQCRKGLESYLKEWQLVDPQHADPTFRQQLEDVMLEEVKYTDSVNPLEMFLKGDYIMRTEEWNSGRRERVKVAAFDEACRQSALLLGVCQAATAAANMAQNVPEDMRGFKGICCRSGGLSGLRSWLKAPFYCRVWPEAFRKARSFGVRMATAISSIGLVFALAEPNAVWPHRNGPMWTLVTIVLILTPVQGASLQRSLRRFCGTALGSLLAAGSIALVGRPDLRILSSHIFALCFALKFFEPELQYAGTVAFVTYMVVIFSLTDDLDMGPEVAHVELMRRSLHLALRRCLDVAVGVLTALVVSVFVAPDRAVDELREREEEALRCAAKGMKAACQLLASHASPTVDQETSSNSSQWTELRKEITSSYESLNFAGDGRPGVGDVLEDARWESAWGVDGGVLLLGGLLWFPSCGRRGPPKAKRCLDAVVTVSRLLRSVQTLMGICQSDFGEDAQRPLRHDPRVWATLGPNGEHFTGLLETTLLSAVHTLTGQPVPAATVPAATASVPATVEELTERLEERMNQLFEAAANSRLRAGGLVGHSPQLGGMKAAAALKLLELCVQNFIQICRQLDGGNSEDATMSGHESRTSHSSEKCQDSETEEWTV